MDRALWISWYDLPDAGRDAYLSWAHGTYMPAMAKRPGVLYAAHFKAVVVPGEAPGGGRLSHVKDPKVPGGNGYIMIVGAEDAHAFGRPTPRKLHATLSSEDRKPLAMRADGRPDFDANYGLGPYVSRIGTGQRTSEDAAGSEIDCW